MIVSWSRDECDRSQNTLPLTRVNHVAQDAMRHWARDPTARIGHIPLPSARDVAYSARGESRDDNVASDQDTSHISETSSNSTDSGHSCQSLHNHLLLRDSACESSLDVSESEAGGDIISDILPRSGGIARLFERQSSRARDQPPQSGEPAPSFRFD